MWTFTYDPLRPTIVEKCRVVPRITVVSQVVFSLLFRAHTSTHGRPLSILLPEFPMSRLRPPRRRKSHRHRPTRQAPAVLPRQTRSSQFTGQPHTQYRGEGSSSSRGRADGAVSACSSGFAHSTPPCRAGGRRP